MDEYLVCGGATIDCSLDFEFNYVGAEQCNMQLYTQQREQLLENPINSAKRSLDLLKDKVQDKVCWCY